MRDLLNAFLNSLYNSEWLKKQRFNKSKAWSYFALFIFAFSVIVAVPVAFQSRPVFRSIQSEFVSKVPEFRAVLSKGSLVVEKLPQPFIFQIPEEKFVLIIDTLSDSKIVGDYVSSTPEGSVIINSSGITVSNNVDGSIKSQKWPEDVVGAVTKQDVQNIITKILQPWFYFVIVFVVFIGLFVAYFISKLYAVAVVSMVVYASARALGKEYKWNELFTMGLYAITLPSIIGIIFTLTGLEIPYVHFIALLAFMLAAVFTETKKRKKKE